MKVIKLLREYHDVPVWYPDYVKEELEPYYENYGYSLECSEDEVVSVIGGYVKQGYDLCIYTDDGIIGIMNPGSRECVTVDTKAKKVYADLFWAVWFV